jgi:gamma-glutamylcyclotransferase (GGCT)/AIG2-like uncharacterized protein YtfP
MHHLFVYGTLMSTSSALDMGRQERARLHALATSLGCATVNGRLYDLGAYPALVLAGGSRTLVHGELLRIGDPEAVFPWLDVYEGIDPRRPADSDYERVATTAMLAAGDRVETWVYVYRRDASGGRLIADGRWRP